MGMRMGILMGECSLLLPFRPETSLVLYLRLLSLGTLCNLARPVLQV
jgi:hypothetical protein